MLFKEQNINLKIIFSNGFNKIKISSENQSIDFSKKRINFEISYDGNNDELDRKIITTEKFRTENEIFEFVIPVGPKRVLFANIRCFTVVNVDLDQILIEEWR